MITEEQVLKAYEDTGLTPIVGRVFRKDYDWDEETRTWDMSKPIDCGCALGALVLANGGEFNANMTTYEAINFLVNKGVDKQECIVYIPDAFDSYERPWKDIIIPSNKRSCVRGVKNAAKKLFKRNKK